MGCQLFNASSSLNFRKTHNRKYQLLATKPRCDHIPCDIQPISYKNLTLERNNPTLPKRPHSWSLILGSQEREIEEHFLHQELQGSTINENGYLQKGSIPIIPSKTHPTLTTLNQIDHIKYSASIDKCIEEHNKDEHITDPNRKSLNSYRIVQSTNLSPVWHK